MSETTHNKEGFTVGYYLRIFQSFLMTILKNQNICIYNYLLLLLLSRYFRESEYNFYTYIPSLSIFGMRIKGGLKKEARHTIIFTIK